MRAPIKHPIAGPSRPTRGLTAALAVALSLVVISQPLEAEAQYGRDAVVNRVGELARRDAPSAAVSGVIESGRLAQGQDVARTYSLTRGTCYWFVAVGDGNVEDLDLLVRYRGAIIARDQGSTREAVVPGSRPYCPDTDRQVQVRLMAFRGGGLYATAVYSQQGTAEQIGATAITDVRGLLDQAAVRYAPGFGQAAEPRIARLTFGEDLTEEIRLRGGQCYRFIAVGGSGVEDLGLRVYQGASEIAHDDAVSSEAVASYCATSDAAVRVRLRMLRGSGEIALSPYLGASPAARRRSSSQRTYPVGADADDYLARQLRSHHSRVGQGRQGASDVFRATLRTSQDRNFPVQLEGGRCYTIIAVGSPSVRDLDLYFLDTNGTERLRETGPENHAVIETEPCPRWSGTYTVRLRVFAGYGPVAVQVFGN